MSAIDVINLLDLNLTSTHGRKSKKEDFDEEKNWVFVERYICFFFVYYNGGRKRVEREDWGYMFWEVGRFLYIEEGKEGGKSDIFVVSIFIKGNH